MATLTGTFKRADSRPIWGWVRFTPIDSTMLKGTAVIVNRDIDVALDEYGDFSTQLAAPGNYWVKVDTFMPFKIYLSSDDQSYRLENVVIWPVTGQSVADVWLANADDGLYYKVAVSGSGSSAALVVVPVGSSSPSGFIATTIWFLSDDGLYYEASVSGAGASLGIEMNASGSTNPSGTKVDFLSVPSVDGTGSRLIVASGSGTQVGLTLR